MNNSMKHYKTIDEWRNCPMANFICPVVKETGLETNTPRGKMFLLSLLCNGAMKLDSDIAKRMYECCLCGLCTQCGFDDTSIPDAMAAARADISENGFLPGKIGEFGRKIEESAGKSGEMEKLIPKDEVTVFITWGSESGPAFEKLAKKAGIKPLIINDGSYDSALLYELGLWEASDKYVENVLKLSGKENVTRIVIDSPHLWDLLKKKGADKKFMPLTTFIKALIDAGKLKLRKSSFSLTYHDPCRLVRDMEDETTVRGIFKEAGIQLKEMRWNKKDAKCCGGPVMKIIAPDVSEKITKRRIAMAEDTNAEKLAVACGHCRENFKECGKETVTVLHLVASLAD